MHIAPEGNQLDLSLQTFCSHVAISSLLGHTGISGHSVPTCYSKRQSVVSCLPSCLHVKTDLILPKLSNSEVQQYLRGLDFDIEAPPPQPTQQQQQGQQQQQQGQQEQQQGQPEQQQGQQGQQEQQQQQQQQQQQRGQQEQQQGQQEQHQGQQGQQEQQQQQQGQQEQQPPQPAAAAAADGEPAEGAHTEAERDVELTRGLHLRSSKRGYSDQEKSAIRLLLGQNLLDGVSPREIKRLLNRYRLAKCILLHQVRCHLDASEN